MEADDYAAIMLAEAGLARLGYLPWTDGPLHFDILDEAEFFPAASQGAIGLELRADDRWMQTIVEVINHSQTFVRVTAEREFLRLLDAGCHTPVGVYSILDSDSLRMSARVFPDQGGEPKLASAEGGVNDPLAVAGKLFAILS
jgi:hydroxymethylbilane synthase